MSWGLIVSGLIIIAFIGTLGFYFWILILKPALNKARSLEQGQKHRKTIDKTKNKAEVSSKNKFCNSCGAVVKKDYNFCIECGNKLK